MSQPGRDRQLALAIGIALSLLLHLLALVFSGDGRPGAQAAVLAKEGKAKAALTAVLKQPPRQAGQIANPRPAPVATPAAPPNIPAMPAQGWPAEEVAALFARQEPAWGLSEYLEAHELSQTAQIAVDIDPSYPAAPEDAPATYKAKLRLLISAAGEVDGVIAEDADMPAAMLAAIIARFQEAKFHPGQLFGYPVASQLLAEIVVGPPLAAAPPPAATPPALAQKQPLPGLAPTAAAASPVFN